MEFNQFSISKIDFEESEAGRHYINILILVRMINFIILKIVQYEHYYLRVVSVLGLLLIF
jgi:hypothetical protein